jgi:hypothetical protein
MILTFKKRFVDLIIDGTKIHTIREDAPNRWKVGMKIHFWCGNPRNPSKNPYKFAEGIVKRIIEIDIMPGVDCIQAGSSGYIHNENPEQIAKNDGFQNWEEMKQFFPKEFKGKLIIWEQPIKLL